MVQESPPPRVKRILGGRGRKLHTEHIHVRRTANKGYIARHELADSAGNPPTDGQRSQMEYSLPDKAAMLAHMDQHMGDVEPDAADAAESGEPGE